MYSSGDPDGQLRDIANSIRTPTQHRRSIVGVCQRQQGHSEANSCCSCHVCIMAGIVLTPASFWGPVLSFLDLVQHMCHKPCTRCTSQRRRISAFFVFSSLPLRQCGSGLAVHDESRSTPTPELTLFESFPLPYRFVTVPAFSSSTLLTPSSVTRGLSHQHCS